MKIGNIVDGLAVIDVKRVNKLNLIQFLKEVDSYLQQGYKLDVQSGRQVGLVLQTDMFKTEAATSEVKVESAGLKEELEDKDIQDVLEETINEARSAIIDLIPEKFKPTDDEEVKVEQKRQTRAKKSTTESKEDSTKSK